MRPRGPFKPKHEITTASAIVTFWCIETEPGGAPTIRPIWSPTVSGSSHQPSSHARTPRVLQARAYSSTRSSAAAGIAPSEWLIRYVVSARIGNRSRYSCSSATAGEYRDASAHNLVPQTGESKGESPLGVIQPVAAPNTVVATADLGPARNEGSDLRNDDGVRGEARGSGLWGTGRGGRGTSEGRNQALRRGLLALLVLALAAPLAASAGSHDHGRAWRDSYLAPSL